MSLNVNKITSGLNTACTGIGKAVSNIQSPKVKGAVDKLTKMFDPTGTDNTFFGMASLMVFTVVIPRIMTAMKRNPDDKEATMDEIKEILFRDIQTILIMLFALKTANSLIGHIATKAGGLPMVNKTYDKLCPNIEEKGLKGIGLKFLDTVSHPIEKAKITFGNIGKALNPLGGVYALSNDEFVQKYSGYNSIPEIKKLFENIKECGGNENEVYKNVVNSLIKEQEKAIKLAQKQNLAGGATQDIGSMEKILNALKELKSEGLSSLDKEDINEDAARHFISFFQDKDNKLVKKSKILNAWLRAGALAFESLYLGFGLPALNQKRLEKKYLQNNPQKQQDTFSKNIRNDLNQNELNLYKNFIK